MKTKAELPLNYDNYVFDLYGTLVDIHTDENKAEIWERSMSMSHLLRLRLQMCLWICTRKRGLRPPMSLLYIQDSFSE